MSGTALKTEEKAPVVERLWYTRSPVPTPLGLASQLGWFLEEFRRDGIDVFSLQESLSPALLRSHVDHHLAHSFRQGGNVQAIWARACGRRTRVIGLNWVDEYQGILTLPETGIRRLRDLRGRRLALPKRNAGGIDFARAGALRGYLVALDLAGLREDEVEFVDVEIADTDRARSGGGVPAHGSYASLQRTLASGLVDVIYAKGAQGVQAADELGARLLLDVRTHPDPLVRANHGAPRPLTVDQELIDLRPDLVARFLARVVDAGDWAAAHPAETLAYVARETRTAERYVRLAYGVDMHLRQRTDLDPVAIEGLRAFKRFLWERGFVPHDFDLDAWIASEPLDEVLSIRSSKVA